MRTRALVISIRTALRFGFPVLLAALAVAAYAALRVDSPGSEGGPPGPPDSVGEPRAHLWIDADGGRCKRASAAAPFDRAAACSSARAAYAAAKCGDTIRYKAGTEYRSLTISAGAKSCDRGTMISFRPEDDTPNTHARRSSVVVAAIDIRIADCWCEVRDIDTFAGTSSAGEVRVDAGDAAPAEAHVVLRRIDTRTFWLPARNVEILGGSAGGFNACDDGDGGLQDAIKIWPAGDPPQPPGDILVEGTRIADMGPSADCDDHSDAIQMLCGTHITIRAITVVDGPDEDVIGRPYECALEDILVENSMFAESGGFQNIVLGSEDRCSNVVVRNNSGASVMKIDCSGGGSGNRFFNNISSSCLVANAAASNNVYTGTIGCGTGATKCFPRFQHADASVTGDLHLAAGDSCAQGRGHPTSHPRTDYDGDARPAGAPDIGADEIG